MSTRLWNIVRLCGVAIGTGMVCVSAFLARENFVNPRAKTLMTLGLLGLLIWGVVYLTISVCSMKNSDSGPSDSSKRRDDDTAR